MRKSNSQGLPNTRQTLICELAYLPGRVLRDEEAPEICSVRDDFAQAFTEVRAARPDEFPSVIRRFKKRSLDGRSA